MLQISGVDKLISPPHHYHDYYPVFLFEFDDCLVYGQRHNTSKVTLQLLSLENSLEQSILTVMHFLWKQILQTSKNAIRMST